MSQPRTPDAESPVPSCPKCEGPMWDNREGKRNPKAPDFKCKDPGCGGVIWPPRGAAPTTPSAPAAGAGGSTPRQAPTSGAASGGAAKGGVDANGMPLC